MSEARIRVLIVDDYEPWRRFVAGTLQKQPELQIIGEVLDGLEAVRQSQELRPDLILLDIGLPTLNGIDAARRIREISPQSKILFVSENRSWDIAEQALLTGAGGYVLKSDAASELLPAVRAVLQGKRFVSASLAGYDLRSAKDEDTTDAVAPLPPRNVAIRHEIEFYADHRALVDGFAGVIAAVLKAGNVAILIATAAHRGDILQKLTADAVDVDAAVKKGSLIQVDAVETAGKLIVNDLPDPACCAKLIADLIPGPDKRGERNYSRVVICGEVAPTLLAEGNEEGAIQLEHLWDEITRNYDADTLCGYLWTAFPQGQNSPVLQRICAEHSAIQGRRLGY